MLCWKKLYYFLGFSLICAFIVKYVFVFSKTFSRVKSRIFASEKYLRRNTALKCKCT